MLNLLLKNIRLNKETGWYEAREAGSTFQIDESLINDLVNFLKENKGMLIADWHRGLNNIQKEKVRKNLLSGSI
ncbi:MAG: hypothetical protein ABIO04_07130 [Ferruginibacter sp.]